MISPQGGIRGITLGCAVGTPSYLASAVDGVTAVLGVTKLYTKPGFFILQALQWYTQQWLHVN